MTREELLNIIKTDHVQCGEAAALARMALAYFDWQDKTAWVQTDKRFDVLLPWGKHRADVLKEYIEHLESRKADSEPVIIANLIQTELDEIEKRLGTAQPDGIIITPPAYPETLPCPVLLEPGLRFGKGVTTNTMLKALQRRADYNSDLDAMTPEQRAEHDANIEAFKVMLPQPAPVVPECFVRFHDIIKERHYGRMPEEVQNAFDECAAMLAAVPQETDHVRK